LNIAANTVQQDNAQHLLKLADSRTDGGWRQKQVVRSAAEMAHLSDFDKGLEQFNIHKQHVGQWRGQRNVHRGHRLGNV